MSEESGTQYEKFAEGANAKGKGCSGCMARCLKWTEEDKATSEAAWTKDTTITTSAWKANRDDTKHTISLLKWSWGQRVGSLFAQCMRRCCRRYRSAPEDDKATTSKEGYDNAAQCVPSWCLYSLIFSLVFSTITCGLALWFGKASSEHRRAAWMSMYLFVGAVMLVSVAADCNDLLATWAGMVDNEPRCSYFGSRYGRHMSWFLIVGCVVAWLWPISLVANYFNMHTWADMVRPDQFDPFDFHLSADKSLPNCLDFINIVGILALACTSSVFVGVTLWKIRQFATTAPNLLLTYLKNIMATPDDEGEEGKDEGYMEARWEKGLSLLYKVNDNFDSYWSVYGCGKIWIMSLCYGLLSLVLSGLGAVRVLVCAPQVSDPQTQTWFEGCFYAWGIAVVLAICALATLTSECDKLAAHAAAMHDESKGTKFGCAQLRHDFIFAVSQTRMGVKISGVRMDFPLLAGFLFKAAGPAVAMYKVCQNIDFNKHVC